jgi:serine/threonine-protein kinase RsbW
VRTTTTLAVHELLVNIVEHAYMGEPGQIDLTITYTSIDLSIVIADQAKTAFVMPDQIDAPDPADLPEGGMGMFIIHQAFDVVKYERLELGNQWTLVKTLGDT